ncbi:hypothetical protein MTR_5g086820 [Medicago truncatula]|uniref:Uncharacterized protein n=1 Tax=Medicago truncatula TaxID=3880 RepID=G7KHC3_MEDTR|nr:hypothetical protein MTR_5g086820 [Medicago truncatula]
MEYITKSNNIYNESFLAQDVLRKNQQSPNNIYNRNRIDETTRDGVQEADGGTKLGLWTESAGGRTRGRVYGTTDLSVNLWRGCTSFTQKSQDHHGSMYDMSTSHAREKKVNITT